MERDTIRLECIKLAVGRTTDHQEALKRATGYFEFVIDPGEVVKTREEFVKGKTEKFIPKTIDNGKP